MTLAKGPLQMLIRLEDFHSWEIGALWKDLTFDLKHRGDFGSIAVVGDTKLEEWGGWLSSFIAKSEVRYFSFEDEDDARGWLRKKSYEGT